MGKKKHKDIPWQYLYMSNSFMRPLDADLSELPMDTVVYDIKTDKILFVGKSGGLHDAPDVPVPINPTFVVEDIGKFLAQYGGPGWVANAERLHKQEVAGRSDRWATLVPLQAPANSNGAAHSKWLMGKASCNHAKGAAVFTVGAVEVWAAENHGKGVEQVDMIVDLAAASYAHVVSSGQVFSNDLAHMNKYFEQRPEVVELKWADQGVPKFNVTLLTDLIAAQEARGGGRVCFACMGGHGRTGTALAALLIMCKGMTADEAIAEVRKRHCAYAIESKAQVTWLQNLAKTYAASEPSEFEVMQ